MSYGPQLPPHLQKHKEPLRHVENDKSSDDDEDSTLYGPTLPPKLEKKSPQKVLERENYGPQLPPGLEKCLTNKVDNNEGYSDDDDDIVGPLPPTDSGSARSYKQEQIDWELEQRAIHIKQKLSESNDVEKPQKRESWMLDLPVEKAKNFGLGPRQFSKSSGAKPKQDRSWTDTPEIKAKRAALAASGAPLQENELHEYKEDKDVLEYMASLKRDQEMDSVANELRKKRGTDSLVDLHEKKKHKKQKEKLAGESSTSGATGRRPFDRDVDLQANRFDEAAKKRMLKNASKLNDKFSSGNQKYL